MFHVYVVRDLVEVEPVYFPTTTTSSSTQHQDPKTNNNNKRKEKNDKVESEEEEVAMIEKETPYRVPLESILIHRLTERYVGRVLVPQGLCIAIHTVLDYSSGEVKGAAGSAWYTVLFSLCVFRPLPETRLHATIQRQVPEGLELELSFFTSSSSSSASSSSMLGVEGSADSLSLAPLTGFPFYVPKEELVKGSAYDEKRKCWYLPIDTSDNDDTNQTSITIKKEIDAEEKEEQEQKKKSKPERASDTKNNRNDYRIGETVLVRILQCIVRDKHEEHPFFVGTDAAAATAAAYHNHTAAMELIGSFEGGSGLGPVQWYGE